MTRLTRRVMQSGVIRVLAAVRMIRYLWASLGSLLSSLSSVCQLSAVLIVVEWRRSVAELDDKNKK